MAALIDRQSDFAFHKALAWNCGGVGGAFLEKLKWEKKHSTEYNVKKWILVRNSLLSFHMLKTPWKILFHYWLINGNFSKNITVHCGLKHFSTFYYNYCLVNLTSLTQNKYRSNPHKRWKNYISNKSNLFKSTYDSVM